MRYKQLGKTNLHISEITLGTWGIGGVGWDTNSEETRLSAIQTAIEKGVNIIDTAPAYNAGIAERYIGKILTQMNCRKNVILVTKCGTEFINGTYVRNGAWNTVLRECDESLKKLQTDYIDIYLVHWPDPLVPIEETMSALHYLKKEGKIKHIGVSNFTKAEIKQAENYELIEVFQPQYSIVSRQAEEQIRWAWSKGIGIMSYGSLGGGILSGRFRKAIEFEKSDNRNRFYPYFKAPLFSEALKVLEEMDDISQNHENAPLSQIAINWVSQKPFISSAIVGMQTSQKVVENCNGFDWMLSNDEIHRLDVASERLLNLYHSKPEG